MSTHKVNEVSWKHLIDASEKEIETCTHRIKELRKSLFFFKKKEASGTPFPIKREVNTNTHEDLS